MMPKTGLTSEEIQEKALQITEERIRQYGFEKFRLTDIARDLKVSHAALYNHFPDKSALLDAISTRWLNRMDAALEQIVEKDQSPRQSILEWFAQYHQLKKEKVLNDPELFKSFNLAAEMEKPFIMTHLTNLHDQLLTLVQKAIAAGQIAENAPDQTVALLLEATVAFHHPRMVLDHKDEERQALLQQLVEVLLNGLKPAV